MKVLLVNPPNPEPPPSYFGPPLGLSLLSAILKKRGDEVSGLDFDRGAPDLAIRETLAAAKLIRPGLIGISCQSSNRGAALALSRRLKDALPELPVVVGGPFATAEPELILRRGGADWAALGDGEETLPELVAALAAGADPRTVPGLAWTEGGGLRRSAPRAPFANLDSLPDPDFDLFGAAENLARFRLPAADALASAWGPRGRRALPLRSALMLLSSRGCVYRCVYCPMSLETGAPRIHTPAAFAAMVGRFARRYGQRDFVFGDNYFTRDRARTLELCAALRREAPGIEWICMTRADAMDAETAAAMAASGCREVSYGVESGSPAVQRAIGKRLRLELVPAAFEATRAAGMDAVLMLMVGNPGDDRETTRETAAFLRGLNPDRVLVHTTKVYPGTGLHAAAAAAGVVPAGFYEGDDHRPPVFTVERTLAQLDEMRAELPSRTVYIDSGAGCVNGCCGLRRPAVRAAGALAAALLSAARRAERAVLGGGESLLLKDLEEALDQAQALEIHDLSLYTTARPLADERLVARLRARKDLRGVVTPLFSPDAARHDARARVPGALAQTKLGLRNWRRLGGEIEAWLQPSREDLGGLGDWTRRLATEGARRALLIHREPPPGWGGLPLEDCARLGDFAAAAAAAAPAARAAGLELSVFGLPPCLWDDAAAPRHEPRALYDETASGAAEPVPCRTRRAPRLAFAKACADCAARPRCDGVWADYLARHGEGELRAL